MRARDLWVLGIRTGGMWVRGECEMSWNRVNKWRQQMRGCGDWKSLGWVTKRGVGDIRCQGGEELKPKEEIIWEKRRGKTRACNKRVGDMRRAWQKHWGTVRIICSKMKRKKDTKSENPTKRVTEVNQAYFNNNLNITIRISFKLLAFLAEGNPSHVTVQER